MNCIKKKFRDFFSSSSLLILLALLCSAVAFITVLPLWKWAQTSPGTYTLCMLLIAAVLALYRIIIFARKTGAAVFLRKTIRLLAIGASLCFIPVTFMNGSKLILLLILLGAVAVYAGAGIILKNKDESLS